jgi:hypothetical protein
MNKLFGVLPDTLEKDTLHMDGDKVIVPAGIISRE